MSLSVGLAQLNGGLKNLRARMEATRLGWNDQVRQEFEERHWQPLEDRLRATLAQMERLSHVLIQAQQETA